MIHNQLPIYHTVTDLQSVIMGALAHVNRDVKPWLPELLAYESTWLSVQIRHANIARDAAKVPAIDAVLDQLEFLQVQLRHAREHKYLPNSVWERCLPLIVSAGKQATSWKNSFAPIPTPAA